MPSYVALLRGINVGGRHVVRMADLRSLLAEIGLQDVRTYIQSGNVAFRSKTSDRTTLGQMIAAAVEDRYAFAPDVMVRTSKELANALDANPFQEADPNRRHLWFLAEVPVDPDLDALGALAAPSERYALLDDVFYLHAPEGIGRSKLAARVERALGVAATARNARTVAAVLALADPD